MQNGSFEDILRMVSSACNSVFYTGTKDRKDTLLECATQIYIAQMKGGAE
jgi:hypothetical protein